MSPADLIVDVRSWLVRPGSRPLRALHKPLIGSFSSDGVVGPTVGVSRLRCILLAEIPRSASPRTRGAAIDCAASVNRFPFANIGGDAEQDRPAYRKGRP